jgi:hypothetical protein
VVDDELDGHEGVDAASLTTERGQRDALAARSTTAGTPVKSCMSTRSGEKAISSASSPAPAPCASGRWPHAATASMSAARTRSPSSWRSRFSNSTLIE